MINDKVITDSVTESIKGNTIKEGVLNEIINETKTKI